MEEYIVLTGASSGIGYEMAVQLAAQKKNLILVARNEAKLKQIQTELIAEHGILVEIMVKDLSKAQAAIALYKDIKIKGFQVNALVNNAGVGNYGSFIETSLEEELDMIELNISSLVALTKLFVRDMVAKGSGRIMNVASLLSFLPFPYYSVYSATKTFVLAFSETLAAELEGTGVIVTALCPGPTETGFNTDTMKTTNVLKANKPISPKIVAKDGVKLLLNGKGKKLVGFMNWFLSNLPRFTPDGIMMKIKKNLASQQK
ncbi:SDR family NAD(P)-dependent oxidoreductase [Pedobacter petrophilus]|uniref:SDR family NAD(P)-dependent oxidoreductase n=1 Tax=Pedobacter petrophilus TaxID=1908241 RepID=A0A7K0G364_9SPHI|nr:SDR family oxidoreductase [Pedobacter petrophilus]MRX77840.1 SDR family NAD(P)-dependent oxidoreductase [Pedobacter petrophilus]